MGKPRIANEVLIISIKNGQIHHITMSQVYLVTLRRIVLGFVDLA